MTSQEALIVLNAVPGIGNRTIAKLTEHFGCPAAVLTATSGELEASRLLSSALIQNLLHFPHQTFLQNEYQLIEKHGVHVVTIDDDRYPEALGEIPDAPVVLYVKGQLEDMTGIAIVGSRNASIPGSLLAERYAGELAACGYTIVSGLARGIDTAAHQGALKANGKTIAVIGSGLADIYPPENKSLSERIAGSGAVVSEFPMTVPPVPQNFPRRNRVISGLSEAVVVVEAAAKSGALITCDYALEQGRDVFVVPGAVGSRTEGSNALLKQGAKVMIYAEDVISEIPMPPVPFHDQPDDQDDFTPYEQTALDYIKEEPVHFDELIDKCRFSLSQLTLVLYSLQIKNRIKHLPGNQFIRA